MELLAHWMTAGWLALAGWPWLVLARRLAGHRDPSSQDYQVWGRLLICLCGQNHHIHRGLVTIPKVE